ncbi:MAG: hypothetical protein ACRDMV_07920 [Streptosporangiales bacterium]
MTTATTWHDLAIAQDGILLREQIAEASISRSHLLAQLDAQRWQALGPRVLVLHNGPMTFRQQLWAAVLNAGPRAALCARTAAAEAGLGGWEGNGIEIVVQRGRKLPPLPGVPVRVHESRRFEFERDVHPTRLPTQTRPERSVVDAAAWTRNPRSAMGLVAAAVQQGITTSTRLLDELEVNGRIRHRHLLQLGLLDVEGGADALSEIDLGRLCRDYGLPEPERQVVRTEPSGRRRYLDAVIRAPAGASVAIEVDGSLHLLPRRYWDDMSRDNELVIAGERRLRFPTIALRVDRHLAAGQIARALGIRIQPHTVSVAQHAIAG